MVGQSHDNILLSYHHNDDLTVNFLLHVTCQNIFLFGQFLCIAVARGRWKMHHSIATTCWEWLIWRLISFPHFLLMIFHNYIWRILSIIALTFRVSLSTHINILWHLFDSLVTPLHFVVVSFTVIHLNDSIMAISPQCFNDCFDIITNKINWK